jgi:CRP/FNR family transcriptional regulator, cyclic AMP receptor protein
MNHPNTVDARFLSQFKSLSAFPSAELEKLAASMTVKRIRKGASIFEQGEAANMLYLLLAGTVRLSLVNQEGKQVLLSFLPPGEILGVASFSPQTQHPFRSDAFSDCSLGTIKPDALINSLLGVSSGLFFRFNQLTMGRVWTMFLRCIGGIGLNLRQRLALALLELSASFGVHHPRGTTLIIDFTHDDLANSIGASRQKVTTCLAEFVRRRIVIKEDRRLIVNASKLRQVVEKG